MYSCGGIGNQFKKRVVFNGFLVHMYLDMEASLYARPECLLHEYRYNLLIYLSKDAHDEDHGILCHQIIQDNVHDKDRYIRNNYLENVNPDYFI